MMDDMDDLEDMFDPEELEMMAAAEADAGGGIPAPSVDDLYDQLAGLSALIYQGGEREAELRQVADRLTAINDANGAGVSLHDQVQSLAEMVRLGAEREAALRTAIKKLSGTLKYRAHD